MATVSCRVPFLGLGLHYLASIVALATYSPPPPPPPHHHRKHANHELTAYGGKRQRSGLMTRLGEDSTSLHGQETGQRELADDARIRIIRSGRPPIMMEVSLAGMG